METEIFYAVMLISSMAAAVFFWAKARNGKSETDDLAAMLGGADWKETVRLAEKRSDLLFRHKLNHAVELALADKVRQRIAAFTNDKNVTASEVADFITDIAKLYDGGTALGHYAAAAVHEAFDRGKIRKTFVDCVSKAFWQESLGAQVVFIGSLLPHPGKERTAVDMLGIRLFAESALHLLESRSKKLCGEMYQGFSPEQKEAAEKIFAFLPVLEEQHEMRGIIQRIEAMMGAKENVPVDENEYA